MPMIQKLYDKHNDPDVLQHIVDILNDGGIIIYPTTRCMRWDAMP